MAGVSTQDVYEKDPVVAYYDPTVFTSVDSMVRARDVILTKDSLHTTDERWELETAWLVDKITAWMPLRPATCLDYGCGIGRLAKPLIERRGWSVLGVDISTSMLTLAIENVGIDRFLVCAPQALDSLLPFGVRFDFALAVWTLQHCQSPAEDIERIRLALRPGGRLFVVNVYKNRFVPVINGKGEHAWLEDGVDVWEMLNKAFVPLRGDPMPNDLCSSPPYSLWAVFEKDAAE